MQFEERPDAASRRLLQKRGLDILGYVHEDAYLVEGDAGSLLSLRGLPEIRWTGPLLPSDRISAEFHAGIRERNPAMAQPARIEGILWEGESPDRFVAWLWDLGAKNIVECNAGPELRRYVFELAPNRLQELAELPEVRWLGPAPVITQRNEMTRWVTQTNIEDYIPLWDQGLLGEGHIVGHIDGPIDLDSCFFRDDTNNTPGPDHRKIVAYFTEGEPDDHGTHTAGSLAGMRVDGSFQDAGIAPMARIVHGLEQDILGTTSNSISMKEALERAQDEGAFVHSNSWGIDSSSSYNSTARDIDDFSYENELALVVFAVSNLARIQSPENAKNVLAVAATQGPPNQDQHAFGGDGPTDDLRRKPEIMAPGALVVSAERLKTCSVATLNGTSAACPAVAGIGVLAREYYLKGFYPTGRAEPTDSLLPSGALLRATLINSAVDLTGSPGYPSVIEGWGRLLIDNTLFFDGDPHSLWVEDVFNAQGLETGEQSDLTITLDTSERPLAVTLVWTDPPAEIEAGQVWINNLDLRVQAPGGALYLGNVYSGGQSVPGGFPDIRNTVEQVLVMDPAEGEWTVSVVATNVPVGPQGYALVVSTRHYDGSGVIPTPTPNAIGDWAEY